MVDDARIANITDKEIETKMEEELKETVGREDVKFKKQSRRE
jgi:hypothetical protein